MTISAALAGTTTYTYDEAGRLIRAGYGDGRVITYTYDAAGNLLTRQIWGENYPPVALSDPTALSPTFRAPFSASKVDLTFQVVVHDGTQASPPDAVSVTVRDRGASPPPSRHS
ncbi:MAG: RHS repeat protein [candidate division NC10 bacterium]|nr:RHS repeat protein [candidate division NC10 bacterium]